MLLLLLLFLLNEINKKVETKQQQQQTCVLLCVSVLLYEKEDAICSCYHPQTIGPCNKSLPLGPMFLSFPPPTPPPPSPLHHPFSSFPVSPFVHAAGPIKSSFVYVSSMTICFLYSLLSLFPRHHNN